MNEKEYSSLLTGVCGEGNYFTVHRAMIKKFGPSAAVWLHYLINLYSRMKRSKGYKWNDGWFYCTVDRGIEEIGFSPDMQKRMIKKLSSVLETKRMGLPAKRYVKIKAEEVIKIVQKWEESQEQSDASQGDLPPTSRSENRPTRRSENRPTRRSENRPTRRSENRPTHVSNKVFSSKEESNGGPSGPDTLPVGFIVDAFHVKAAKKLHKMLMDNDDDLVAPSNGRKAVTIPTLAKAVLKLETSRRASRDEIKEVIDWLKDAYSDPTVARLHKVDNLISQWGSYKRRKLGWESDRDRRRASGEAPVIGRDRAELLDQLFDMIVSEKGDPLIPSTIREALKKLGRENEKVTTEEILEWRQ